jgi:hypothetical protein
METIMRNALAMAALAATVGLSCVPAHAQSYVVNGHTATLAEVGLLASYGAQPGHWVVNGFGISAVADERVAPKTAERGEGGCWYDLDMPPCE